MNILSQSIFDYFFSLEEFNAQKPVDEKYRNKALDHFESIEVILIKHGGVAV